MVKKIVLFLCFWGSLGLPSPALFGLNVPKAPRFKLTREVDPRETIAPVGALFNFALMRRRQGNIQPEPESFIPIGARKVIGAAGYLLGLGCGALDGIHMVLFSAGIFFFPCNDMDSFLQRIDERLPTFSWINTFEQLTPEQRDSEYAKLSQYYSQELSKLSRLDRVIYGPATSKQPLVMLVNELGAYAMWLSIHTQAEASMLKSCSEHIKYTPECPGCTTNKQRAEEYIPKIQALTKLVIESDAYKKQLSQARWDFWPRAIVGLATSLALVTASAILMVRDN